MDAQSDTVTFNVGGKMYQVLRAPTLSLHPESVLHQLAEDSDGSSPIFIEADADLFQYILQFLRHRKVLLPATVSKAAVLREAAALGVNITEATVEQELLPSADLSSQCKARRDEADSMVADSKARLLAGLVIRCAVAKLNQNDVNIIVSRQDLVNAHAADETQCMPGMLPKPYPLTLNYTPVTWGKGKSFGPGGPFALGTATVPAPVPAPAQAPQGDISVLENTVCFLLMGLNAQSLLEHLQPWAHANRFAARILQLENLSVEFSPVVSFQ